MDALRALIAASPLLVGVACAEVAFVPGADGGAGGTGSGGTSSNGGEPGNGGDASTGGAGGGGESCLNGLDDDDDGLIDCADPDCDTVACLELPAGWLGPVELRPDASDCAGDFANELFELKTLLDAPPASCACSCDTPNNACQDIRLRAYNQAGCTGNSGSETLNVGACEVLNTLNGRDAYRVLPPEDDANVGGSCGVTTLTTLPMPSFESHKLCAPARSDSGCTGVCAPAAGACIYQAGPGPCPDGYELEATAHTSFVDSRTCASNTCGCGSPMGTCNTSVEIFFGFSCVDPPLTMAAYDTCENFAFADSLYSARATLASVDAACAAVGVATATGTVTPADPFTVCCAP